MTDKPKLSEFGLTDTQRIDRLVLVVTGLVFVVALMFVLSVIS